MTLKINYSYLPQHIAMVVYYNCRKSCVVESGNWFKIYVEFRFPVFGEIILN